MNPYKNTKEGPVKTCFNIRCPSVSSCPEGSNCTKNPVTCSRAREMSASGQLSLNGGDSIFKGLGNNLISRGLESSLKDYFSSEDNYNKPKINYTESPTESFSRYQETSLLGRTEDYKSLRTILNKYDASTDYRTSTEYQSAA